MAEITTLKVHPRVRFKARVPNAALSPLCPSTPALLVLSLQLQLTLVAQYCHGQSWAEIRGRWGSLLTHLFEESDDILTDLGEADDDIVHEDVIEGGMISALPPGLMQDQIPTVHR